MNEFFGWLTSTGGFVAQKDCGEWTPGLVWLHVGSDLFIWLAFLSIPLVLLYFVRRRQDLPFSRLFVLLAASVLACGFTHFLAVLTYYHPFHNLSGMVKLVAAVVSWVTVLALVPAVPKILELIAPAGRAADPPSTRRQLADRPPAEIRGYMVAVLAIVLAVLVRRLLDPILGNDHPYVVPLLAIIFVAWEAGFGPAVLAAGVLAVATRYWFVQPRGEWAVEGLSNQVGFGLFVFIGLACALLGGAQWAAADRAKRALAEARGRQAELEAEIARREKVEHALRESEGRFRSMADSVPVMIWVSGADRGRTYFNRTWLEFTGRPLEDQPGDEWAACVHPDDRDTYRAAYTAAFEGRRPFELEYRLRRHDGAYRWVLARGTPRFAEGGEIAGFSGLCIDISDRKEAVEGLKESEARKTAMFETALDCVVTIDEQGRVIEFNPAAEQTFGYAREEVLGREMAALIVPPAMRADHRRGLTQYLVTGEGQVLNRRVELTAVRRDGTEFPAEVAITPIRTGGRVTFTSYLRDITDRRRAEEGLAERVRLAALRADITARFATAEPVRVVLQECVELLVRHLGVAFARVWTLADSGAELELQASAGLYTHLNGPHARVKVGEFKIGRIAATRQLYLTNDVQTDPGVSDPGWARREGIVAFAGYPLSAEGRVVGVLAVFARHPLTDAVLTDLAPLASGIAHWISHQRAVAAVRESEERFRTLAETIPQLVWTCTPAGACDYLSRQWAEYTGVPAADQLGTRWTVSVHPDDRDGLAADWAKAVAAGADFDSEFRIRGADGVYRWFKTRAVPARGADGAVFKWVGTNTDIDAQKREAQTLEHLVRERTAELRRSNQELEQFAYIASHDLQEPLRKIQAFGDRLRDRCRDQLPDQGREYLDRMLSSAGRMSKLIDDLLTFSRVITQARPFARTDLTAVLADVIDDLAVRIERAGADVAVGPLPVIDADPTQMRQLFQNLIGNALKFARPDVQPVIRVRGELFDGDGGPDGLPGSPVCRVTVADNGIGFDEKYLDRIFQVFQRLHGRGEYEGTGVGLAICKKIADRHGGTITARSEPGRGAEFILLLPARHVAPAGATNDTTDPG
ncbi:MAG: domain S-box [Gemmataceae bacterium]|nr:domain S-box [Gemmataceae bacterium]